MLLLSSSPLMTSTSFHFSTVFPVAIFLLFRLWFSLVVVPFVHLLFSQLLLFVSSMSFLLFRRQIVANRYFFFICLFPFCYLYSNLSFNFSFPFIMVSFFLFLVVCNYSVAFYVLVVFLFFIILFICHGIILLPYFL